MRADIHPEYVVATVHCSCGNTFNTGGRIDRFERRYGKRRKG